jgi:pilus assembly protein TadC
MKQEHAGHAPPIAKKGLLGFLKPRPPQPAGKAAGPHGQAPQQDPGGKSSSGNIVPNAPNLGKSKTEGQQSASDRTLRAEPGANMLRGFYPIASVVARFFPMIEFELEAAGKKEGAVEYISGAFLVFTICFAALSLFTGIIVQTSFGGNIDLRFRIIAVVFSAFAAFAIFFYFMLIPRWMSSKKMALINQDLLFATRHIMIQTSAGVPLYDAIVSVSEDFDDSTLSYEKKGREYGEVGREFARIILQVRSGKDLTTALEESAAQSPSENFRKVVWQLSNANRTGTRIGLVLHDTVNFLAAEQLLSIRSYGAQLSTLALFYMLGCIIAPTMGIVVLAIGANILPDLPVNEMTFLLILALLVLVQAFFVGLIKSRRPTVSL